jgi:hypothetical protein
MSVPPNKALQPTVFTQVELHITLRSIIAQFNLRKKVRLSQNVMRLDRFYRSGYRNTNSPSME